MCVLTSDQSASVPWSTKQMGPILKFRNSVQVNFDLVICIIILCFINCTFYWSYFELVRSLLLFSKLFSVIVTGFVHFVYKIQNFPYNFLLFPDSKCNHDAPRSHSSPMQCIPTIIAISRGRVKRVRKILQYILTKSKTLLEI